VLAWVKPGTVFEFDIDVTNLSDMEFGALLWLLDLNRFERGGPYFHRFGGGKPLGFGSVKLEIAGLDLRDGAAWAAWYRTLVGNAAATGRTITDPSDAELIRCLDSFKTAVARAYGNGEAFNEVRFIKAFLTAAKGFDKPIHYPRIQQQPDPKGENFKWFENNERGPRIPLGPLYGPDPGLPRGL
jgi:hypothetical protein